MKSKQLLFIRECFFRRTQFLMNNMLTFIVIFFSNRFLIITISKTLPRFHCSYAVELSVLFFPSLYRFSSNLIISNVLLSICSMNGFISFRGRSFFSSLDKKPLCRIIKWWTILQSLLRRMRKRAKKRLLWCPRRDHRYLTLAVMTKSSTMLTRNFSIWIRWARVFFSLVIYFRSRKRKTVPERAPLLLSQSPSRRYVIIVSSTPTIWEMPKYFRYSDFDNFPAH